MSRGGELSRRPDGEPETAPVVVERVVWEERVRTLSVLRLVNVLLRHRWEILGLGVGAAVLAAVVTLLLPPTYTAGASFTAQTREADLGRVAGLASQLGFDLPSPDAGQSPEFYAALLRSPWLLRSTVEHGYGGSGGAGAADSAGARDLVEYYGVEGDTPAERAVRTARRLREDVAVTVEPETGLVRFGVTLDSPGLAEGVGRRMLGLVEEFNISSRQTRARAERDFLESRVETAGRELRRAEDSLAAFLERNRQYEGSPELRFAYERLQRRVRLQEQVYETLAQSLEQSRIEEVRTTPVITVVDSLERPALPDERNLLLRTGLGLAGGLLVGLFWAFGREYVARARREESESYRELRRHLRDSVSDARRLLNRWSGGR